MISFPNCKINIGLYIESKRNDGYHNIKTFFYPLPLCDILEIIPSNDNSTKMFLSGKVVEGDINENLCMKAYNLIKKEFNIPSVKIYLNKIIPIGAGLGGGSSDAAYTILTLNKLFSLNLTNEKMMELASCIGSDCAFFIKNKPSIASERGNVIYETDIEFNLKKYKLILIKPYIHISTKDAYQNVVPLNNEIDILKIINQPINTWKTNLQNNFEEIIFKKYQEIKNIKEILYANGAVYASMSGSGASVYGIFENEIPSVISFPDKYYVWKSDKTN